MASPSHWHRRNIEITYKKWLRGDARLRHTENFVRCHRSTYRRLRSSACLISRRTFRGFGESTPGIAFAARFDNIPLRNWIVSAEALQKGAMRLPTFRV